MEKVNGKNIPDPKKKISHTTVIYFLFANVSTSTVFSLFYSVHLTLTVSGPSGIAGNLHIGADQPYL